MEPSNLARHNNMPTTAEQGTQQPGTVWQCAHSSSAWNLAWYNIVPPAAVHGTQKPGEAYAKVQTEAVHETQQPGRV